MDIYELLEKRNPVDKEKESKSLVDQLIKRNEILSNEIKSLNNIINELEKWLEENRYHIDEYDGVLTYLRELKKRSDK